ncbi:MAG: glycoside hydrolase family 2 TIM barrel-domain containing protein, partial [Planctomycetota bacterium]
LTGPTNDQNQLEVVVLDDTGEEVASGEVVGGDVAAATLSVQEPRLWSPGTPELYTVRLVLREGDRPIDTVEVPCGIRSLDFSAERGFLLNGKPTLLRGCNLHHDNGLLGGEAWRAADARRIKLLKERGYNAVRCSHNPPSASFLDACDRLGMLVIDEAFDVWRLPKRPQDYHLRFVDRWRRDLRAMILRDRNRPSVIIWSIGNEITERARPEGVAIAKRLVAAVKELDDTRPVTNALCSFWDNPDQEWEDTVPAYAALDIGGYNYLAKRYEDDHEKHPDRIMMGTESFPPRAHWFWTNAERLPYVIGDFVWTGIDYIGESGLAYTVYEDEPVASGYRRPWPWFVAWCGDLDLIGNQKPQSRYRDVLWNQSAIAIAVHEPIPEGKVESINYWGWPKERRHWDWDVEAGTEMNVAVYSRCERVGIRLNGRDLAEKAVDPASELTTRFRVPYETGEIEAYGVTKEGERVSTVISSTGDPSAIRLTAEPVIDGFDDGPRFIRVEVCDTDGQVVPTAEIDVELELTGGQLLAVGTGSPTTMASFTQPRLTTFRGRGLAIVLPTEATSLTATAAGLQSAKAVIE